MSKLSSDLKPPVTPVTPPETPIANAYHFVTQWRIPASCEEVYRTLEDVDTLADWWPSVYLDIKVLDKGQPGGVNKLVELYTKGWLPYTLRWKFRVTRTDFPHGFALDAFGDFVGRGIWTFEQDGPDCLITYDWQIAAEKPLLKRLSALFKPIFSANHLWAMRQGEKSLVLELRRRRGEQHAPLPPGPTWPHNWMNNRVL